MARKYHIMQADLQVDPEGPMLTIYRYRHMRATNYRPEIFTTAERKRRFIDRATLMQKAIIDEQYCGTDQD